MSRTEKPRDRGRPAGLGASRRGSLADGRSDFNRRRAYCGDDLPPCGRISNHDHTSTRTSSQPMTLALFGVAAVVFSIIAGVGPTPSSESAGNIAASSSSGKHGSASINRKAVAACQPFGPMPGMLVAAR